MVIIYSRYNASEIILRRDDLNSLRGADLRGANLQDADLRGANLRYADLRYADLRYANLKSADLRYTDLEGADLRYADLRRADLRHENMKDADLSGAKLPDGIPILDRPYTQILGKIMGGGVLDMDDWHKCETTHCLAGWLIHLGGKKGSELEGKLGSSTAGALIHARNCPDARVPNFHVSKERAMAYIVERAEREKNDQGAE